MIKLETCADEKRMKLLMVAPGWEFRDAITKAFQSEGTPQHHLGTAPPGWLEEELSLWVAELGHHG